jgi:hypothetical protein
LIGWPALWASSCGLCHGQRELSTKKATRLAADGLSLIVDHSTTFPPSRYPFIDAFGTGISQGSDSLGRRAT